ncbi:thymidine phosphorylase [Pseudogemmobacter sonorensis]|uniref:thymidine phosphorylase n=1 Tax=Pseudogemmobacter sonorensis TaxID=2989681 RepID=UPI00367B661C
MDARTIIAKLRDGARPSAAELGWFARGLASGAVSDAQAGAFAMAALMRGRTGDDGTFRVALTRAMRDSGRVLEWDLNGPVVDKHSTGGVGDCVSLLLAPALAACGAYVPMISGRGLGHTGGTLDKLEAIPGFGTELGEERFRAQVEDLRCAIVAADAAMAPADRRLYAVRDVTATVESVDLITASILSKKLAAGLEVLVLDVKCGAGAFMKTPAAARDLAQALVETARGAGCRASALISGMEQPLVPAAGNALEVIEVMETLADGPVNPELFELVARLGGEALARAGQAADRREGAAQIGAALSDGRAAERFGRMVAAQGGPVDFVERWRDRLPAAPYVLEVQATTEGHVAGIDTEALGQAVVHLGGGRLREGDRVNPAVGLSGLSRIGDRIEPGAPLALIHAADEAAATAAARAVAAAYRIGPAPVVVPELFIGWVG